MLLLPPSLQMRRQAQRDWITVYSQAAHKRQTRTQTQKHWLYDLESMELCSLCQRVLCVPRWEVGGPPAHTQSTPSDKLLDGRKTPSLPQETCSRANVGVFRVNLLSTPNPTHFPNPTNTKSWRQSTIMVRGNRRKSQQRKMAPWGKQQNNHKWKQE